MTKGDDETLKQDQLGEWSSKNEADFNKVAKADQKAEYASGPLNKNKETRQFEGIIDDIINEASTGKPKTSITLGKDGNLYYQKEEQVHVGTKNKYNPLLKTQEITRTETSEKINLTEIIDKTNFTHISISKDNLDKYLESKQFNRLDVDRTKQIIDIKINAAMERARGTTQENYIKSSYFEEVKNVKEKSKISNSSNLKDNELQNGILKEGDKIYKLKIEYSELEGIRKYSQNESEINAIARGNYKDFNKNNELA